MPSTRSILYPGTVGVVTIKKLVLDDTGEPQAGQKLDPSDIEDPHFVQFMPFHLKAIHSYWFLTISKQQDS
jgi:hypothetical protein